MNNMIKIFILIAACSTVQGFPNATAGQSLGDALRNLSPENKTMLAEKIRETLIKAARPRQEDEDEDGPSNILPAVLKVVGSVLSLNASGLIESSTNLLPPTAQNYLSGALEIIASVVAGAKLTTQSPVRTTVESISTAAPSGEQQSNAAVTTQASTRTTDEDDDSDEESTPINLRSNATTFNSQNPNVIQNETTLPTQVPSTTSKFNQIQENDLILPGISDPNNKANGATIVPKSGEGTKQNLQTSNNLSENPSNTSSTLLLVNENIPSGSTALEDTPVEKREDKSKQTSENTKSLNATLTFGEKLNALLNSTKPDVLKYNPELGGIIQLMKFIVENSEVLKEGLPSSAPIGLYGSNTNSNYANKFKYVQSSTTVEVTSTIATSATVRAVVTTGLKETTTEATKPEVETTTEEDEDEDEDENV